ncbi:DExH-box ATP-dependent RNA helicase DExH8 [Ricinus communis]|uniref:DExH-box ATP-dependent RNA helicase DExH8 n=1 Tax=Ricinus communis TaxID=3988 RepID=UPI00201A69DD|nr:DExH-box ATP-dependent RNA helicase DExH8 [Ricinus communis]
MAESSSSTSSCSSSRSSPFLQREFASLPIMSLRQKIVEKVLENRVTLIVGDTGCGKSSQVPQFLLEENMEPILCTQPRRFAVVAVAKMVAKARNCELGGEVGYHIGHLKHLSERSKIVFKTAGVLSDEMREKGLNALKYKVIILDEVHERSIESDLVLVCVKQFLLRNNDLRVVLMSATADFGRYRDYFKDLGRGERVEVLAIPSSNQQALFQRRVSYLEQMTEFLGISSEVLATKYCSGPSPAMVSADIKPEVHKLIHDLVMHIHDNEPDIEKGILVFLPTYHDLLQQWYLLKPLGSCFKVHILHGSIDTEQALLAMKIWKSHRKVILATNIAESSVTIPKVAYVIDSCRSLQVFWDGTRKKDYAELVWVSKSQADQRKGRTGRTCDGQIYRLVTRSFFNKLQEYESPAILRLSLRQQVLMVCCAESKAINDPRVLLQKTLDPPDPRVIEDALNLLVHIKALDRTSARGRYEPTFYGRLLASFPLSFDASFIVLKFGDVGLLREGILIGILMDIQPQPILHPFGEEHLFAEYAYHYYGGDCNNMVRIGRKEMILMGNLCAYKFWQRVFKDRHRLEHLKRLSTFDEMKAVTSLLPKIEEEWCSFHNLVWSSLHQVSEIYEDILSSLHRFRPRFLGKCDGLPTYYDPYEFGHVCLLKSQQNEDIVVVAADDEHHEPSSEIKKCCAVPFVDSGHFQTINVAEKLLTIVKEIRSQLTDDAAGNDSSYVNGDPSGNDAGYVNEDVSHVNEEAPLCVYFVNGSCNKGSQCSFSHSLQAKKPACRYFFTLQGCRNGESCSFSHDIGSSVSSCSPAPCPPEDDDVNAVSLLQLFPTSSDGCILLLEDSDLHFSLNFACFYDPSKIISTTCMSETSLNDPSLNGVRILWEFRDPCRTIISKAGRNLIPWSEVKCILWFPSFASQSENLEGQKILVQNFFDYLASRIIADSLYELRIIITMNNVRFAQLQVEKLGRESFFFLGESFPFDEASFGELADGVRTRKPMPASKAISYVFDLQPPTDIQFDDYAATLHKCLHDVNG